MQVDVLLKNPRVGRAIATLNDFGFTPEEVEALREAQTRIPRSERCAVCGTPLGLCGHCTARAELRADERRNGE